LGSISANATGERRARSAILEAEGRSEAIRSVYSAIKKGQPDPTLVAILQLDALARFAESNNANNVILFESAALLGAAQTLRSVLAAAPSDGDQP
jgi:hypothetical protein